MPVSGHNIAAKMRYLAGIVLAFVLFLLTCFVWISFRSSIRPDLLEADFGLTEKDGHVYFTPAISHNEISEVAIDDDNDGEIDKWKVICRPNTPVEGQIFLRDANGDGYLEAVEMRLGPDDHKVRILLPTSIGDSRTRDVIYKTRSNERLRYRDLNGNGYFDMVVREALSTESKVTQVQILLDSKYHNVDISRGFSGRECWITLEGEEATKAVFSNGSWTLGVQAQ